MPLPLTVSCSSKIQIGFTFLVPAYPDCPGKEADKWLLLLLLCFMVSSWLSVITSHWHLVAVFWTKAVNVAGKLVLNADIVAVVSCV